MNRIRELNDFRLIEGDLYPIYWGKDKQLGARPHQHLYDPTKTGAIRLSAYTSLAGKTIACVSLTVADFENAERSLQKRFPDLLKTSTKNMHLTGRSTLTRCGKSRNLLVSFMFDTAGRIRQLRPATVI
ncbi:hypothetical protein [Massilia sp. NR 4-1]|uniref:hypothetical protein n=1 Tax=Massilia sp. NR 4-1 TaxID=1678028 RepID=UPI00067CCFA1|nr:hypothetical protein [Massilia sp. NR 4-1]AKU23501.1 hypothetical protein ACZ75_20615 [Massilia sp. NR 4-1]